MRATITRKDTKMKVHIAKKHSNDGKEYDVELMFGKTQNDVDAYKKAKSYIWNRAKQE